MLVGIFMTGAAATAQATGLFAQAGEPIQGSLLLWYIRTTGLFGLLMLLVGVGVFLGALRVVWRAEHPEAIRNYYRFLLLPLIVGIVAAVYSGVSELTYTSVDPALRIDMLYMTTLRYLQDALITILPSFVVLSVGKYVRTRLAERQRPPA